MVWGPLTKHNLASSREANEWKIAKAEHQHSRVMSWPLSTFNVQHRERHYSTQLEALIHCWPSWRHWLPGWKRTSPRADRLLLQVQVDPAGPSKEPLPTRQNQSALSCCCNGCGNCCCDCMWDLDQHISCLAAAGHLTIQSENSDPGILVECAPPSWRWWVCLPIAANRGPIGTMVGDKHP